MQTYRRLRKIGCLGWLGRLTRTIDSDGQIARSLGSDGKLKIEGPNLPNINEFRLSKQSSYLGIRDEPDGQIFSDEPDG